MGGCFGCNSAAFALARAANVFQWYGLESSFTKLHGGTTTMHCWVPRNRKRNKPPLVLLHAFGLYGLSWVMQVPSLSRDFDLYIPDLVFFGKSTSTSSQRSEFFQAECVMELLQAYDVNKFDVVGTSYGGFVAYRMAHMYPDAVHSVVISNSAPNKDPASDENMVLSAGVESVDEFLLPTSWRAAKATFGTCVYKMPKYIPDFVFKDYLELAYGKDGMKEKRELLDGLTLGKASSPELPKLSQDVLLLWGDQDKIFDVEYAYKLKRHLGSKAQIAVIKDTAHAPQFEKPGEYSKIVTTYLLRPLIVVAL